MRLIVICLMFFGCSSYYEHRTQVEEIDAAIKRDRLAVKECRRVCGRNGVQFCAADPLEIKCYPPKDQAIRRSKK